MIRNAKLQESNNGARVPELMMMERSSGKLVRRFRLPENPKMDETKASMENGVLSVVVPKEEQKKPKVKAIDISD
ncbi:hypothetical protein LIER_33984 [Lithospermum erythrorhizon]|uniref:SHSP domain-containing protein n=1 Tax=Lithospermum erythrorhizon TaxID=34254 RepID=A0AAV3RY81_LITER